MEVTNQQAQQLVCCRMVNDSNTPSGLAHCMGASCMAWRVTDDGYEYKRMRNDEEQEHRRGGWEKVDHPTTLFMRKKRGPEKGCCGLANFDVTVESQF